MLVASHKSAKLWAKGCLLGFLGVIYTEKEDKRLTLWSQSISNPSGPETLSRYQKGEDTSKKLEHKIRLFLILSSKYESNTHEQRAMHKHSKHQNTITGIAKTSSSKSSKAQKAQIFFKKVTSKG